MTQKNRPVRPALGYCGAYSDAHGNHREHVLRMRNSEFRDFLAEKIAHQHRFVLVDSRKEHHEFLAPVPGHRDVGAFHLEFSQERGDPDEAIVAGLVPVRVVEPFEIVDVEEQDRDGRAFLGGFVPFVLVPDFEHPAVVNAGKPVGRGEFLEFFIGLAELRLQIDASRGDLEIRLEGEHFPGYLLFVQIHVPARIEPHGDVVFVGKGGQENDERAVILGERFDQPDFLDHFVTGAVGQRHVEKHDVGAARAVPVHGLSPARRRNRLIAEIRRGVHESLEDGRTVLYDEEVGLLVHGKFVNAGFIRNALRL